MQVTAVETMSCDAGWRNYSFVKVSTTDGIIGWSEFDEGFGSPGVGHVVRTLAARVVGRSVMDHELVYAELRGATRPGSGGVVGQAIGAIENALLDAKAKALGVPCHTLLGGKIRDRIPVYWSHCGTYRIAYSQWYGPRITDLDGLRALGAEVREQGFPALKTNLFTEVDGRLRSWAPRFGIPLRPDLNVSRDVLAGIAASLEAFRDGAGPDVGLLLDLNFNMRSEGIAKLFRYLEGVDLFWIEIDNDSPEALGRLRARSPFPISGCETLIGLHQFLPYFANHALDVAIIDGVWNGMWQAMKIAASAAAHDVMVAPHNFYGHLSTMMNVHFSAAVPNLRIMETDIDRLAWDHELFTVVPTIEHGEVLVPDTPGWGTEPDEAALAEHPPKEGPGFLVTRRTADLDAG